jgi:hypothetical protein
VQSPDFKLQYHKRTKQKKRALKIELAYDPAIPFPYIRRNVSNGILLNPEEE